MCFWSGRLFFLGGWETFLWHCSWGSSRIPQKFGLQLLVENGWVPSIPYSSLLPVYLLSSEYEYPLSLNLKELDSWASKTSCRWNRKNKKVEPRRKSKSRWTMMVVMMVVVGMEGWVVESAEARRPTAANEVITGPDSVKPTTAWELPWTSIQMLSVNIPL